MSERTILNPLPRSHAEAAASVESAIGQWAPILIVAFVLYEGLKIASSQVPAIEGALSTRIQGAAGPNILNGSPTNTLAGTSVGTGIGALPGPNLPACLTYSQTVALYQQALNRSASAADLAQMQGDGVLGGTACVTQDSVIAYLVNKAGGSDRVALNNWLATQPH